MKYTSHDIVVIERLYDSIFIFNGKFSNNCLTSNDIFHAIKNFFSLKNIISPLTWLKIGTRNTRHFDDFFYLIVVGSFESTLLRIRLNFKRYIPNICGLILQRISPTTGYIIVNSKNVSRKKSVSFHSNVKNLSVLVCRAEFIFLVLIFIVIVFPKDILS